MPAAMRRTAKMRRQRMPERATGIKPLNAERGAQNVERRKFSILRSSFCVLRSPLPPRNHDLLQRPPILLRRQPYRRSGRTSAHARGSAADAAAQVAFHGDGLFDFFLVFLEERRDPPEQRERRLFVDHEDVAVWAVALAVAAADAVALDVDLAARVARERVGRAVEHAARG